MNQDHGGVFDGKTGQRIEDQAPSPPQPRPGETLPDWQNDWGGVYDGDTGERLDLNGDPLPDWADEDWEPDEEEDIDFTPPPDDERESEA